MNVIFLNSGTIVLQTDTYCHFYDNPKQAANDWRDWETGSNTDCWDGNEPEGRIQYSCDEERNGGYQWLTPARVASVLIDEAPIPHGYAEHHFFHELAKLVPWAILKDEEEEE